MQKSNKEQARPLIHASRRIKIKRTYSKDKKPKRLFINRGSASIPRVAFLKTQNYNLFPCQDGAASIQNDMNFAPNHLFKNPQQVRRSIEVHKKTISALNPRQRMAKIYLQNLLA